jgi:signal peptidase I
MSAARFLTKETLIKWRPFASGLAMLLLMPVVAVFLTLFVFQSYEVKGMSMQEALHDHDRLVVWKVPRTIGDLTSHPYIPDRYDIIVFGSSVLHEDLIKRVIGLPGERVVILDGQVTVYNAEHPQGFKPDVGQTYAATLPYTPGQVDVTVPENHIFVLGDNRDHSTDSSEFGPIPVKDIVGKLVLRVFPFESVKGF